MVRSPCCEDTSELTKGPWSKQEDKKLVEFIRENGHENWRALPKKAGLNRCGKSCRLRWKNYLRPNIKRGEFSDEEELLIIKLHSELGSKWSIIASQLPGRTDNDIKNHWNTRMRKKLNRNNGINPITHQLLQDPNLLTNLSLLNSIIHPNWNNINAFYPTNNLQFPQNVMQIPNQNHLDTNDFPLRNAFDPANQLQLSQNLMEITDPNSFPNLINSFGGINYSQIEPFHRIDNMLKYPPFFNTLPSVSNPMTSFDGEFQPKLANLGYNNLNTDNIPEPENSLPSLFSLETPTLVNQVESNFSPVYSPSSIMFEDLDKFWEDGAM